MLDRTKVGLGSGSLFRVRKYMDPKVLALELLRKLGIRPGQTVLDFGCGPGTYVIPAAEIVGKEGRVYALEKDYKALDELMANARRAGIHNIERIDSSGDMNIDLEKGSIDVVLLFDVFHSHYFQERSQRGKLLAEIQGVLKRDGELLVYPKHMEADARSEIEHHGFCVRRECSTRLIHDRTEVVQGDVLIFGKNPHGGKTEKVPSFEGYCLVSCGTLSPELNHLRNSGFLDADKILYTRPGLHENPREFEKHLRRQLHHARQYSAKVIVVYGKRCYIDTIDPFKSIDKIIGEEGGNTSRVEAANCIDMLADAEEREGSRGNQKVYWLSPGWLKYWRVIFKEWDIGLANETFPQHDKAILLDALGFFDSYTERFPERILQFSDWMKIGIEPFRISLDRFKQLLGEAAERCESR
jgi:SAM-dependent methyltransferase